jgi:phosphoserine phosphatase
VPRVILLLLENRVKGLGMTSILVAIANPERAALPTRLVRDFESKFGATPRWLAKGEAVDMVINGFDAADIKALAADMLAARSDPSLVDLAVLPDRSRRKRLLISDMDSTMITVECIDELADFAGVKDDVSSITRRAMNGELDFEGALNARVSLLAGLSLDVIDQVYRERVRMMPGARTLVQTMRRSGAVTALVSGGFVPFAERVAAALGFDEVVANRLESKDGYLTGRVLPPITDADTKLSTLNRLVQHHDLSPEETLAVGDGANDAAMVKAAGLGVAYRPHPVLARASHVSINAGDLTALLYLQGIPKVHFFVE